MSVSAVKGLRLLAIVVALAMILATVSPDLGRNESIGLFLGACAVLVIALLWYRRAIRPAEAREEQEQAAQLTVLKQQITLTGEPIAVRASSNVLMVVFMAAFTMLLGMGAFSSPSIALLFVFVLVVALTLVVAWYSLPLVGKPALTIKRDGIETPVNGFFPWEEIESIGMRRDDTHGVTSYSLHLYVPRLEEREARVPTLLKLRRFLVRGSQPNFVVINLHSSSMPGPLVHALCYDLWRARTGRTKTWTTVLRQEDIELMRRGEEQVQMMQHVGTIAQKDPVEAMKLLDEIKKKFPIEDIPQPKRKMSNSERARMNALMADLRTIDPLDGVARKRVMDKHVKEEVRRRSTVWAVMIVVGFALMIGAVALFG